MDIAEKCFGLRRSNKEKEIYMWKLKRTRTIFIFFVSNLEIDMHSNDHHYHNHNGPCCGEIDVSDDTYINTNKISAVIKDLIKEGTDCIIHEISILFDWCICQF